MTRPSADVRLERVEKRYGAVTAVKPLDLHIAAGTLVTLLGPSGCGKTTLLRMIAGLEQPSGGRILIGGRDVTGLSPGERDVSLVFQSYALFPHMTVLDNVAYGLVSSGLAKRQAEERAQSTLATVGLAHLAARLPSELSGGQQQRVAVARAITLEPAVLLFDEPLSNLDARLRRRIREEIRDLQQRFGLTVVYVTHDQSEALAVSDTIVVMRDAEIAQIGTPAELYEQPADAFVAGFMGEANQLTGQLVAKDGRMGRIELGRVTLELPHRDLPLGAVELSIRPEAIRILEAKEDGTLPGTILRATYLGATAEYTVGSGAGELFVISPEAGDLRPIGSEVALAIGTRGVSLIAPTLSQPVGPGA